MEIRIITKESVEKQALDRINEEAIPDSERNRLDDLLDTGAEVLGIIVSDEPAGFMVVRQYGQIVYLAYLAVRTDLRSKGIGGHALRELIRKYPEQKIVVEFEAPVGDSSPDSIRLRRKNFYIRNGFYETGWYTFYDETEFEIGCSAPDYDPEVFNAFVKYLGTIISDHIPKPYRKHAADVRPDKRHRLIGTSGRKSDAVP